MEVNLGFAMLLTVMAGLPAAYAIVNFADEVHKVQSDITQSDMVK